MAAIEEADPATRRTLADPAEAVGRPAGQVWHCEHECGFTGSYSAVILHEGACAVGEVGRPPTPRPGPPGRLLWLSCLRWVELRVAGAAR